MNTTTLHFSIQDSDHFAIKVRGRERIAAYFDRQLDDLNWSWSISVNPLVTTDGGSVTLWEADFTVTVVE